MSMLRLLTLFATVLTVAGGFMGSYVRGRGAGLSCPDWPLCYGQVVPEFDQYILLEWTHRMMVGALSLAVATAMCSSKRRTNTC